MPLPIVALGAGLAVGAAAFKAIERLSNVSEAERQLRLQKVATAQSIRTEKENEKRRALLRQARLNALEGQVKVMAGALNVIGGASLAAINATLAHGASLEQAWDAAQTAQNIGTLRLRELGMESATESFIRNQYIGIAGDALGAGVQVTQIAMMGAEANEELPEQPVPVGSEADAITRGF